LTNKNQHNGGLNFQGFTDGSGEGEELVYKGTLFSTVAGVYLAKAWMDVVCEFVSV